MKKEKKLPAMDAALAFGSRMALARKQKGWTQAQRAIALTCDVRVVSRYEINGSTPSVDMAARIANALGVSLDVLAGNAPAGLVVDADWNALVIQAARLPADELSALKRLVRAWLVQG